MIEDDYVICVRDTLNALVIVDHPRWPDDAIRLKVRVAARKRLGEIAHDLANADRGRLLATSGTIAHGGSVPASRIGPVQDVQVIGSDTTSRPARLLSPEAVQAERDNALGCLIEVPYAALSGETLWHTGDAATVQYVPESALEDVENVPPNDECLVIADAAQSLLPWEGSPAAGAANLQQYAEAARRDLMAVRGA